MSTWSQQKAILLREKGYKEKANKWTKFGAWFAEQVHDSAYAYGDWCAMFQIWGAAMADDVQSVGGINKDWAWVPTWADWFRGNEYREGALAFFNWGSGRPSHVGRVLSTNGTKFKSLEGNHNNKVTTVTRYRSQVYRFGMPLYSGNVDLAAVASLGI